MIGTTGSDEDLTAEACWDLLASVAVGRLAVVSGGLPDIFPINHLVEDRSILFRTAEGTKLAAAVLGRAVAFEVDGFDPAAGVAWSVVAKGPAIELGRLAEVHASDDLPLFPWHTSPKPVYVRIRPERVTGRRFEVARP